MRRSSDGWAHLSAAVFFLAAGAAQAQLPDYCGDPGPGEFEKTVCVVDPQTDACDPQRTAPLFVDPGEILEYQVTRCNNSGTPCFARIRDDLDEMIAGREDRLTFIANPLTECGSPSNLGGAICEEGPPYVQLGPSDIGRCGQDCLSPTDELVLRPSFFPQKLLSDGMCFRMTFRAAVGSTITATECICNRAWTLLGFFGPEAASDDPNWVTLERSGSGEEGCPDVETCADPDACAACVKTDLYVDLSGAQKCIVDEIGDCEQEPVTRFALESVAYRMSFENTGTIPATDLLITDTLPAGCQASATAGSESCSFDPGLCPNVSGCTVSTPAPSLSVLVEGAMDPGCIIQVGFETTVDAGATAECCNSARAQWTLPTPGSASSPDACYTIEPPAVLSATKDVVLIQGRPDPLPPRGIQELQSLDYRIVLSETGGGSDATDVSLSDVFDDACIDVSGPPVVLVSDPNAAPLWNGNRLEIANMTVAKGDQVTIDIQSVKIRSGAALGDCCNQATGTYLAQPGNPASERAFLTDDPDLDPGPADRTCVRVDSSVQLFLRREGVSGAECPLGARPSNPTIRALFQDGLRLVSDAALPWIESGYRAPPPLPPGNSCLLFYAHDDAARIAVVPVPGEPGDFEITAF